MKTEANLSALGIHFKRVHLYADKYAYDLEIDGYHSFTGSFTAVRIVKDEYNNNLWNCRVFAEGKFNIIEEGYATASEAKRSALYYTDLRDVIKQADDAAWEKCRAVIDAQLEELLK